jgi:hypothetical protein
MAGSKQQAYDDAKKIRDQEFDEYDKEIEKWKNLYAKWKALVAANDMAAARALQPQLDAQARLIDIIRLKIEGKLEAMDALQRAATLGAALTGIDGLIGNEAAQLQAAIDQLNRAAASGNAAGVGEAAWTIAKIQSQIAGKLEIRAVVAAEKAKG